MTPDNGRSAPLGRVLHYIDTTGPGGGETVFLDVASGMRERGWQPHVVLVGPGWVLDNVRHRSLPFDVVSTRGRLDVGYALRIRSIVRNNRIGIIHAHFFSPSVYASAVSLMTGVPVVATFHGAPDVISGGRTVGARYRLVSRRSVIACVSDAIRRDLLGTGKVPADAVTVIHNGIDVDRFDGSSGARVRRELGITEDSILIGSLGNIRPAKDYATLLRAAALLAPDERFKFAIAGDIDHPLYHELLSLRDQLDLSDRVSFLGFRDDASDVLAAFDILAISSRTEGFSLAAVQAMAAGTPVVATRSGGPEEIITDGVDGLLVSTGSPGELADAIRRMASDRSLRSAISTSARETVAERFSTNAMLDGYEALYTRLTSRGD